MPTPHISAQKGDFATTVLMPGDPLRAKYIAENYLENSRLITSVRNMFGYTGSYNGNPVSVMGSGMGCPSMGIYSYELFSEYDVKNIIRIGSAGSYCEQAKLFDVILASKVYSDSNYAKTQGGYDSDTVYPSDTLNMKLQQSADRLNTPFIAGCIHCTDVFYGSNHEHYKELYEEKGCLCVEMESFALLYNAFTLGKNAACLYTVSDSFVTKQETTSQQRETAFDNMIKIALGAI